MGAPLYIMSRRRVTDRMWGWRGPSSCSTSARMIAGKNGSWIEFGCRPWPWRASYSAISSSISGGSGWLQGLHGKAVREEIWMELSARP